MAEGSGAAVAEAATAVHDGWTLAGEGASEAVASIKAEEADAKGEDGEAVRKAASELGRKGGKAAAKARAEAKDAPEPAAKDAKAEPKGPAEPAEADDDAEDEGPDAKRSRARQRVEEATRKAAEERRERERVSKERDEWKARAERIERERQAPQPQPEQRRAEPDRDGPPKPAPQDFEDYEQYLDARDKWNRQEWQRETEERAKAEKRTESVVSKVKAFQTKIQAEGGAEFLAEISQEVQDLRPSIALQQGEQPTGRTFLADAMLLQSEHAPALMRHMSENPRDFQRIAELGNPYQIAIEVGRLVGLFEARGGGVTAGSSPSSGSPASKPVSKAPPPVRPVTGAPSTAAGDYFREGEDFDSWNRRQRAAAR